MVCIYSTCELSVDIQGHGEICDQDTADTIYEDFTQR